MFYDAVITLPKARLKGLLSLIEKIESQVKEKNMIDAEVLNLRLAPDMFSFAKQIQIATDNAKGMASRLARVEAPKFEDNETTLSDLKNRLNKTISYLETFTSEHFKDADTAEARFPYFPGMKMVGKGYVFTYGIPNFMFHVVTAYSILRNAGFDIGKADFMGGQIEFHPDTV
ncbi:MAG: DUF1993 domain-containing protein [Candidatus Altimarinota bacterium]